MPKKSSKKYIMMSSEFRSGSALASCILNAHPDIKFSTDIIKYWLFTYSDETNLNSRTIKKNLTEIDDRLRKRFSITFDVKACLNKINNNFAHSNVYKNLYEAILDTDKSAQYLGENETLSWKKIPYFLNNVKNSKAFMIIRDPRDVLVSFKKHTFVKGNNYLVSVFNSLSLMQSWKKYEIEYKDKFHGIRYEDLKTNPKKCARNMTSFLNIEYTNEMIKPNNWMVRSNNGWELWENEKSSSFYKSNKNHLSVSPINRWKKLIDPVDHFICEWVLGDIMVEFGYKRQIEYSQGLFDKAIKKLTSTKLLSNCLYQFLIHNKGSESYPVDPKIPKNWEKNIIRNYRITDKKKG